MDQTIIACAKQVALGKNRANEIIENLIWRTRLKIPSQFIRL